MFSGVMQPINTYETDTGLSAYLGMERDFADEDRSLQFATRLSEYMVRAVYVQNTSGGTLSPGMALKWVAGHFGSQVQKATANGPICGFVPWQIQTAATIPNNAFFWMIVKGPSSVLSDGSSNAITEGDWLSVGGTSGEVATAAAFSATAANANVDPQVIGARAWAASANASAGLVRAYIGAKG